MVSSLDATDNVYESRFVICFHIETHKGHDFRDRVVYQIVEDRKVDLQK